MVSDIKIFIITCYNVFYKIILKNCQVSKRKPEERGWEGTSVTSPGRDGGTARLIENYLSNLNAWWRVPTTSWQDAVVLALASLTEELARSSGWLTGIDISG